MLFLSLLIFLALFGCKTIKDEAVSLKGLRADETTKTIDYDELYKEKDRPFLISFVIGYTGSYDRIWAGNYNLRQDESAIQALTLVDWFKAQAAKSNGWLGAGAVVKQDFPEPGVNLQPQDLHRFVVDAPAVNTGSHGRIKVRIEVILGASVDPSGQMTAPFREVLARAMVGSHVMSYNGHIWAMATPLLGSPWMPMPVDLNTLQLADRIMKAGGRSRYGIIYMNACKGEIIEKHIMSALMQGGSSPREPILFSHRNYSNFGFFAAQNVDLFKSVLREDGIAKLMLHQTTSYFYKFVRDARPPHCNANLAPQDIQRIDPLPNIESPAEKLRLYYQKPQSQEQSVQHNRRCL